MKPFFVAVSIFISSLINTLNAQTCTVASFPTLPISYDCGSYDVLKPVNLPNFPASGTLMMTVAFTVKSLAFCDDSVVNPTFFSISIKVGGVDKRILHFTQSSSDKNFYIFVTDTVGTPFIVAQQLVNEGTWVRLAVSIQLASALGKVAQRGLSNQQYTTNSKTNLQFSTWKFDSTTQLSISSDIGGLNPVNFSFRDLVVEYMYTDTTLYTYLFGANRPTPIASYFGTAGSTSAYTFKDLIGYIGTGYVGASTPTFNDDTYSPAWTSNTPSFQYEYQYARIPADLMIQPWDELTLFSMTINFKIQVTKTPVYTGVTYPIFKRSKSTGATLMSISLKYTRVITVTYGSLSVDSSGALPSTMTDVTVFFATLTAIGGTSKTGVIIIYFGTVMQGTESAPATLTTLYSEVTTDTVYIGRGAVANIGSFKIYSPGTAQINKLTCALCAPSTYISGTSCLPCDASCKTCSGSDSASCLSCQLDKYLSGTTCLPCDFSCQSCTGPNPNQCSSCYHGYFLSGTSCLPCASTCATCVTSSTTCTSCLNGKYLSGTSCLSCHISCATCAAGVSTACLTCPATDYYSSGSSCPACHTSCRTCTSNTDYTCLSCYTTRYLMYRAPPDVANVGNYCVLCTSPCATCTAEGVHNCLTCISGKYLNGTRCQTCQDSTNCVCHANCQTCIGPTESECLTCPAGRYFVKNNTGTYCLPCVSPCANCITTSTTCTSCITGKYLFGSTCKCDVNCQNCDGPTSNDCTSCFDGKYLSGKTCVACQSPCVNCLTATQCTSCITNRFLVGTDCVGCTSPCVTCTGIPTNCTSCIAGKYVSGNLCTNCDTPCVTCSGAGSYNCSSCGTGLALYAVAGQGNTCLVCHTTCLTCNGITDSQCTSCPSGRYSVIIGLASYCYACTSPCATCAGLDTSCTSCIDGTYLDNNKCFTCTSPCQTCTWSGTNSCTSCIPGTYLSGTTCKPCNYPCQTCSGPGSNACLSCVSESYLSGTSCPLCDPTCQTCSGPGPNSCTSCAGGKILSGTACLPCSPLCARCSGLQADECTSCVTGAYMAGPGTTCISCTSPCKTCTGSSINECASCEDGTYLVGSSCGTCDLQCRTCSGSGPNACTSCPQGTNLAGTSCVYCDPACQTCNGPNANQCLTCVAGKYLSGTSCILCNLPCVTCTGPTANDCTLCAPGTYLSGTTCQPCTDPCATCTGAGPNSCISCIAGTYQSGTTCYTCTSPCKTCSGPGINACISCIAGKYLDSSSSQCQDCDPSCNECTGPSANECKSCPPGSYLVGSSCVVCDISCLTCTGDAANQCTSCYAGKYLNGNTCVGCTPPCARCTGAATNQCKSCTDGAYLTGTTCLLCTPPCKSCTGPQTNSCTSCVKGTFLVGTTCQECTSPCSSCTGPGPNACTSCPTSHYLSNSSCLPCHKSCLECTGPEAGACTSCFDGVYLFGGFCVTLSPEEEKAVASAAAVGTTMTQALTGGLVIASIASSGDPSGIASGTLVRMLEYIRYINISYPPKLEALFMKTATASDSSPFSITPNMPSNIKTNLGSDPPPRIFSKYQVPSSFLMNYWDTFISSCIILGIVICLKALRMLLSRMTKKHTILHTILKRLLIFTQNYLLIQFYESIGDVILFSSLEFRAVHFKSWGVISLLVSLLCLMVGTAIFVWHFRLIKSYQHIKKQAADHTASDELGQFEKNYEGVQVLYDEFKDTSFNHQAFLFFFASRDLAFSLTLSVLIDYPLAQISTITGLNIMMFAYLISKRPLKSRINALQHIVCEVILLTVNSIVIVIAVLSISGAEYKAELDYLGQIVIICSVVLYVVSFFFLVPRTLRELRDLFKYLKNFFKKFFRRGRQTVSPNEIKSEGKVIEQNDETIARAKRDISLDNQKEILQNHSDSILRPREEDSSVAKINLDISQIDYVQETLPQADDYSTRQFALDITPQASQEDQGRWFLDSKNAQTLDVTNVNQIEEGIKQPVVDEKILEEEEPNLEDTKPENANNQDDIDIAEINDEMGGTVKLRRKIELSGEMNSSQMIMPKTVTLTPVRLDFSDLVQEASLEERITRLSGFTPGEKKIGGDFGDTAETKVRRRK